MRRDLHRVLSAVWTFPSVERLAVVSLVGALTLLWLGALIVTSMKTATWDDTKYDSMVVVNVLSEHLKRSFAGAQASLQGIATILDAEREHRPEEALKWLFSGSNVSSTITDFRVLDRQGKLLFASVAAHPSAGDLEALTLHADRPANGMHLSAPIKDGKGGYELVASVPFFARNGLSGVVTAHFSVGEVERLYESVQLDRGDALGLIHDTKRIVYRTSDGTRKTGLDVGQTPISAEMRTSAAGSFQAKGTIDGVDRIYTYSKVMGFPLHVYLTKDVATVTERFWERTRWIVVVVTLLAAMQAALSIALIKLGRARSRLEEELRRYATTDTLTKLANRRRLDETLASEWQRSMRTGTPIGLLMVDADYFKRYNDHYGHPDGDKLLATLARVLASHARRSTDLAARFGGEEFVLLLPGQGPEETHRIAEEVRSSVEALQIEHAGHPTGRVTVSVGSASLVPDATISASDLLACADEALYRAKVAGRNAVMTADDFLSNAA